MEEENGENTLTTHTHKHTEAKAGHQTHLVREKLASSIIHMYMLPSYRSLPSLLE